MGLGFIRVGYGTACCNDLSMVFDGGSGIAFDVAFSHVNDLRMVWRSWRR